MLEKIKIKNEYIGFGYEGKYQYDEWKTILKYKGRQFTLKFKQGLGYCGKEPNLKDVLECCILDTDYINYEYYEYLSIFGYEDSSKNKHIYKKTISQSKRFLKFIGDEFDNLREEIEEELI